MIDVSMDSITRWAAVNGASHTTARATRPLGRSESSDEASDPGDPDYTPSAACRPRAKRHRVTGPKRHSRTAIALPDNLEFAALRCLAHVACAVHANPALLAERRIAAVPSPQAVLAQMRVLREQTEPLAADAQAPFHAGVAAALAQPGQAALTARELALEYGHVLVNNKILPNGPLTPVGALLRAVADTSLHPSARFAFAERGFAQALRVDKGWPAFTEIEREFLKQSVALFAVPTASTFEKASLAAVILRYALTDAAPDLTTLMPGLVRISLTPVRDHSLPSALRVFAAGNAAAVLQQGRVLLSAVERDAILTGLIDGVSTTDVSLATRAKLTATLLHLVRRDRLKMDQNQALAVVPAAVALVNDARVGKPFKLEIARGLVSLQARNHAFVPVPAFESVARFALKTPIGDAERDDDIRHAATVILADASKAFQADIYALAVRAWFADIAAGSSARAATAHSVLTILHDHPASIRPDDFRTLLQQSTRVLAHGSQTLESRHWLYDIVTNIARGQSYTFDAAFSRGYAAYVRAAVQDPELSLMKKREIGNRLLELCVRDRLSLPTEELRGVLHAIGTEVTAKLGAATSARAQDVLTAIA